MEGVGRAGSPGGGSTRGSRESASARGSREHSRESGVRERARESGARPRVRERARESGARPGVRGRARESGALARVGSREHARESKFFLPFGCRLGGESQSILYGGVVSLPPVRRRNACASPLRVAGPVCGVLGACGSSDSGSPQNRLSRLSPAASGGVPARRWLSMRWVAC